MMTMMLVTMRLKTELHALHFIHPQGGNRAERRFQWLVRMRAMRMRTMLVAGAETARFYCYCCESVAARQDPHYRDTRSQAEC